MALGMIGGFHDLYAAQVSLLARLGAARGVVPLVETTVMPRKSSSVSTLLSARTRYRAPVM